MPPLADPIAEAERILEAAEAKKVVLRLFGGVSFYFRCPSAKHRSLQRNYVDLDFMGHVKQAKTIKQLFIDLGYVGRDRFNAMQEQRLIFNDIENKRRIDIFLDVFEMCHKLNLKKRLEDDNKTIPIADMLATKLQIVELGEKDIKDILCLMADYEVGSTDANAINGAYLAKLCGDDWGIYKTFTTTLDKVIKEASERTLEDGHSETVRKRAELLRRQIEESPKSFRWRMRAIVGEKVRWYELPEADKEMVDSRNVSSDTHGTSPP
jgi:hypothetical protein